MSATGKTRGKNNKGKNDDNVIEQSNLQTATNKNNKKDKEEKNVVEKKQPNKEKSEERKQPTEKKEQVILDHFIGIIYGGTLKTGNFILITDENKKFVFLEAFNKLKYIFENKQDDNKNELKGICISNNNSDSFSKFIEYCNELNNASGRGETDKIFVKDNNNDGKDDIINYIHLVHAKNCSYLSEVIQMVLINNKILTKVQRYPTKISKVEQKAPDPFRIKKSNGKKKNPPEDDGNNDGDNDDGDGDDDGQQPPRLNAKINKSKSNKPTKPRAKIIEDDDEKDENDDNNGNDDDEIDEINEDDNISDSNEEKVDDDSE